MGPKGHRRGDQSDQSRGPAERPGGQDQGGRQLGHQTPGERQHPRIRGEGCHDRVVGAGPRAGGSLRGNKLYDVVHYDFTVILPARYLRRLYENLRLQNFHTVLDVKISMPGGDSGMSPAAQSRAGESYYYYGTDPVVQAKITGELLLLTDWTRGRWDAVKKEWDKDYPPLMPEQFLKWIARDASVLRQEDQTRAPAAATPTMSPMAMPQPARAPAPLNIPRGRTRE